MRKVVDKSADKAIDLRRSARFTSRFPVEIELDGQRIVEADMMDVSRDGFRLSAPGALSAGSRVRLRTAALPAVPATIVWRRERELGCAFEQPLNPVTVLAIRAHSGNARV